MPSTAAVSACLTAVLMIFVAAFTVKAEVLPVCTGVGASARAEAEEIPHTLKIVFAQPDGDFVSNVDVVIFNSAGSYLAQHTCNGPWMLLNAPTGSYNVEATFQGTTRKMTVFVPMSGSIERTMVF